MFQVRKRERKIGIKREREREREREEEEKTHMEFQWAPSIPRRERMLDYFSI